MSLPFAGTESGFQLVVPVAQVTHILTDLGIAASDPPSLITGMISGLSTEAKLGLAHCLRDGPCAFFRTALKSEITQFL